jgi:tetratricopeptide (TPR) repeat protein
VVVVSGELFDAIEFNAARTGNHKRAAVRMSRLAEQVTPSGMSRAEAHMRAGEQWLLADDPEEAAGHFRAAIADAGPTFGDPRVGLARAMFALGRADDADSLLRQLTESGARAVPRTCDLVAELLAEQGDLEGALDWATAGVDACLSGEDHDELQLLLRLRYRIRVDLGLSEDEYDKMLDRKAGPAAGRLLPPGAAVSRRASPAVRPAARSARRWPGPGRPPPRRRRRSPR